MFSITENIQNLIQDLAIDERTIYDTKMRLNIILVKNAKIFPDS